MSTVRPSAQTDRQARWIHWLIPALLVVAIPITYANSLHGPFIFDDYNSILANPHIRVLFPLTESMAPQQDGVIAGRPLVSLTLAANYAAGQFDPFGYHLFNLSTHLVCALLLYGLIRRTLLLKKWNGRYETTAPWFAGAAALIWALHPIQTESVDYVTQRTETMFSMFLVLTLYCLARAEAPNSSIVWRVAAVGACAAGMACKEVMIVAPLLALLYQWIFLTRNTVAGADNPAGDRRAIWATHFALVATTLIIPLELHHVDMMHKSGYGLQYLKWYDYLNTQPEIILHYLRLCFWPAPLALDYFDWPIRPLLKSAAILPALPLALAFAGTIVACCKRWWPGFLGAWFFLILGPTSSIVPILTEVAAERRMYLPLASVVIFTLAIGYYFIRRLDLLCAGTLIIALMLAILTIERNAQYQSAIAIWTDTVSKRPGNPRAHFYLGLAYAETGDWQNAITQDDTVLRMSPNFNPGLVLRQYILDHAPRPADGASSPSSGRP